MKRSSHTLPVTSESVVESITSSKQLQEPKSSLFSFFNPYYVLVRTKERHGETRMKVEGRNGREKQVGATPHFRCTKHHMQYTNFSRYFALFSAPSASHSSFLFLIVILFSLTCRYKCCCLAFFFSFLLIVCTFFKSFCPRFILSKMYFVARPCLTCNCF